MAPGPTTDELRAVARDALLSGAPGEGRGILSGAFLGACCAGSTGFGVLICCCVGSILTLVRCVMFVLNLYTTHPFKPKQTRSCWSGRCWRRTRGGATGTTPRRHYHHQHHREEQKGCENGWDGVRAWTGAPTNVLVGKIA